MTNPADSFFGESSPSAKFDAIGTTVGGVITRIGDPMQQTDFSSGKPLTWDDGTPRMQLPVTVQTDLRDPSNPLDDGKTYDSTGPIPARAGQPLPALLTYDCDRAYPRACGATSMLV